MCKRSNAFSLRVLIGQELDPNLQIRILFLAQAFAAKNLCSVLRVHFIQLTIDNGKLKMRDGKNNTIEVKSFDFAVRIIKLYQFLRDVKMEYVLSKQLLRSGTSIGANVNEAQQAQSKADFISKMLSIVHFPLSIGYAHQ